MYKLSPYKLLWCGDYYYVLGMARTANSIWNSNVQCSRNVSETDCTPGTGANNKATKTDNMASIIPVTVIVVVLKKEKDNKRKSRKNA